MVDHFVGFEVEKIMNRNIKNMLASPCLPKRLTGHEEIKHNRDATNIVSIILCEKATLKHKNNVLKQNKNVNELLFKLLLKNSAVKKTTLPFHFTVKVRFGSIVVFQKLSKR